MMSPQDSEVYQRVLNDIRSEFKLRESFDYLGKVEKALTQHVWDILATLEAQYNEEVNEWLEEESSKHREGYAEVEDV